MFRSIVFFQSQLSAMAIMTIPTEVYSFGWQYALLLPSLIFVTLVTNYISLPVFYCNNIDNCYKVSIDFRLKSGERFRNLNRPNLKCVFILISIWNCALAQLLAESIQCCISYSVSFLSRWSCTFPHWPLLKVTVSFQILSVFCDSFFT